MNKITKSQQDYYGSLFKKYHYSPLAVASGKQIYKNLRFQKLSEVFGDEKTFSVHDVGMGLGHYYEYLKKQFPSKKIKYSGSEVVKEFVDFCREKYPSSKLILRDLTKINRKEKFDYVVFGGTFYHKQGIIEKDWEQNMQCMLNNGFQIAKKAIVFNCLTQYCDYFYNDLYYPNFNKLLRFINKNLSRFFKIDHNYPLFECTISVYKATYIESLYNNSNFKKYFK